MFKQISIIAATLALALPLQAADSKDKAANPASVVYDAQSAFSYLKTLAGDWERQSNDHEHGSSSRIVTFRVSAAGSAVIETYNAGLPNEMVSVYHMDGKELMMTHYCALQNAPVMKFEKSNKPGEIKLAFAGGTNFDPKVDAHAHEGLLRVTDTNTFEAVAVGMAGGKLRPPAESLMKRKQ